MIRLRKYPRTPHLEGSRMQPGDHNIACVPLRALQHQWLVVEEKLDGANAGISFDNEGELFLQCRGHFLTGGHRERHFDLFKRWASVHRSSLWRALGSRHVLYGEWLYAKHTIYYDALPHYFLEFDVLDRETGEFLSTSRRRDLLSNVPVISVPVIWRGKAPSATALRGLVTRSAYKSPAWTQRLDITASDLGLESERVRRETDPSDEMEGLYIKAESESTVLARYKLVRSSFLTNVIDSGSHWLDRPIVPNRLADGVELFAMTSKQ